VLKRLGRESLEEYSRDAGIISIRPAAVLLAEQEEDVVAALQEARESGLPMTPRGSGTSIPSQSVGRGLILLQSGGGIEVSGSTVKCRPAVIKADLNASLKLSGRWMPVDPSSYRACSVGGMVSNNSSGARTYKYGSTIDYVESLRVVLPEEGVKLLRPMRLEDALSEGGSTGKVARLLFENMDVVERERPSVTKNSSGYRIERVIHDGIFDLPKLFVGSEGTLGVVTEAEFRTVPVPGERKMVVLESSLQELDRIVSALRKVGPAAVELVDKSVFESTGRSRRISRFVRRGDQYLVFCEFDGTGQEVANALEAVQRSEIAQLDPVVLEEERDVAEAWDVRNETLVVAGEMKRGGRVPVPGVEDLVAPREKLGELIENVTDCFERRGLEFISYGHAGDSNLHMRPLLDPSSSADMRILRELMEECIERVLKMGGSMSGEHGDGMLRARFLKMQYRETYWIMKEIKQVYDPKWLLNPGVKIQPP
jgi:FAD/FMN-containing dehydrogenase